MRLAVASLQENAGNDIDERVRADIAASFQAAVVDTLVAKCGRALELTELERLVIAGGVGANRSLRATLAALGERRGVSVYYPRPDLCTDNGAMIAIAGALRLADANSAAEIRAQARWSLDTLTQPGAQ